MINIIVAHDKNRVIGINGKMPWFIKKDLEHFKEITLNSTVIMGKNTFNSIGHPLINRQNIIISSTLNKNDDLIIAKSLDEAIKLSSNDNIFIIGGSRLYEEALDIADYLYITYIDAEFIGDTYFPNYDISKYEVISEELHNDNNLSYKFITYKKI